MGLGKSIKGGGIFFPIVLLGASIVITLSIYLYTIYLVSENAKLEGKITEQDNNIAEIEKDQNLQIYSLIVSNKRTIDMLSRYSQITTFISSLDAIAKKYSLVFEGFQYANGVISTKAKTSEEVNQAYKTVSDFIDGYRGNPHSDFDLPFISRVSGSNTIEFDVKFEVKAGEKQGKILDDDSGVENKKSESENFDTQL